MVDLRKEAKKALSSISLQRARKILDGRAYQVLEQGIQRGSIRPGADLLDGRRLSVADLSQGHCYSPPNHKRVLHSWEHTPHLCGWCGQPLPDHLIGQHRRFHPHALDISHHFHDQCWMARLLALAIVFGFTEPQNLLREFHQPKPMRSVPALPKWGKNGHRHPKKRGRKTRITMIERVFHFFRDD